MVACRGLLRRKSQVRFTILLLNSVMSEVNSVSKSHRVFSFFLSFLFFSPCYTLCDVGCKHSTIQLLYSELKCSPVNRLSGSGRLPLSYRAVLCCIIS